MIFDLPLHIQRKLLKSTFLFYIYFCYKVYIIHLLFSDTQSH